MRHRVLWKKNMKRLNYTSRRPWGSFYDLAQESGAWNLKVIFVKKGSRLSLQKHTLRSEFWVVANGTVHARKGTKTFTLLPGDSLCIPRGVVHRLEGITDAWVIEITFGRHLERDIVRIADDYGRIKKSKKG